MRTTMFYAAKGGQGVTVTAMLYAFMRASTANAHVALLAHDPTDLANAGGWMLDMDGIEPVTRPVYDVDGEHRGGRLTLVHGVTDPLGPAVKIPYKLPWAIDEQVIDAGTRPQDFDVVDRRLLVTHADYLALRRYLDRPDDVPEADAVVMIRDAFPRPLASRDVEEVIGKPVVAQVAESAAVARCVDAGLMGSRVPREPIRQLRAL